MDNTQRATLMHHLNRRLQHLDDEELVQLESLTRPHRAPHTTAPSLLSRRFFLQLALASGAAATGAAALKIAQTVTPASTASGLAGLPAAAPVAGDAAAQLADLTAQLFAANNTIADLRAALSNKDLLTTNLQTQLDATLTDLGDTRGSLAQSTQRNQALAGLIALYDQLDALNLDDTVLGGLFATSDQFAQALDQSALVQSGAAVANAALDAFENAVPQVRDNITWLGAVMGWLTERVRAIESTLGETVASGRMLSETLAAFFIKILSLLPFGWGEPIQRGLDALGHLVNAMPQLVAGVEQTVLPQLSAWFGKDSPDALSLKLVAPMRSQALDPALALASKVASAQTTYTDQLATPTQDVLTSRRILHTDIARYRQDQGV